MIKTLIKAKSSLELVKDKINKLRLKLESLIEKKEEARRRLIEKRAIKSEEVDLADLNKEEFVADIEEVVADISNQIDGLEREILTQVAEMEAQLVQKEVEKKQLENKRDEIQNLLITLKSCTSISFKNYLKKTFETL